MRRARGARRNNGPGYRRITEIAVICVDDGPRGIHPVRQSNGLGCRAHKAVIVLGTLLVIRGEVVDLLMLQAIFQTGLLDLLTEMKPELDDDSPG